MFNEVSYNGDYHILQKKIDQNARLSESENVRISFLSELYFIKINFFLFGIFLRIRYKFSDLLITFQNMANSNLRWENHSTHFRNIFYELLNSNLYTDVTLICDDKKQLNAHKVVLASCSNVFKNFITELPEGTKPFIYLRGIQVEEMKSNL